MNPVGRPTLFTPEVRQKIIKAVRGGNYDYIAAQSAGVSKRLLAEWKAKGRKEKVGEYAEFLHAITEAENDAEIEAVDSVRAAGQQDPKHHQWWLERKCPERWGRDTYQIKQLQSEVDRIKAELGRILANQGHQEDRPATSASEADTV